MYNAPYFFHSILFHILQAILPPSLPPLLSPLLPSIHTLHWLWLAVV